jgi:hypothetical protein
MIPMKTRFAAVALSCMLAAGVASAKGPETALTPDNTLFVIEANGEQTHLELTQRVLDQRASVIVPGTDDEAIESDARLAFDGLTQTLFVLWHRSNEDSDEIRIVSLNREGQWSEPITVAAGAGLRRTDMQVVISHAREEGETTEATLVHAAWWGLGETMVPEYAMVAFENGAHVSTTVEDLNALADRQLARMELQNEDTGEAVHPPLALARNGSAVDIAFGNDDSTAITKVRIEPRQVSSEARMWRPVGRSTQRTPPTRMASQSSAPVQAFVARDRVVLYTPDAQFRYIVFENGEWTPIRMIELDENLSSEDVIEELRRTVEDGTSLHTKEQTQ